MDALPNNFFSQFARLGLRGSLQMVITTVPDQPISVSLHFQHSDPKAKADSPISPITLTGSATELDAQFFERLTTPLQAIGGLLDNISKVNQQVEKARKEADEKREKDKKATASGQTASKAIPQQHETRYKTFSETVDGYAKNKEYRRAIGFIDKEGKQHPNYTDKIAARRAEIIVLMEQKEGGLFGIGSTPADLQPDAANTVLPDPADDKADGEGGMDDDEEVVEEGEDDTEVQDPFEAAPLNDE